MKKIKIAYITEWEAGIYNWSGTTYYIRRTLEQQGFDVYSICILEANKIFGLIRKTKLKIRSLIYNKFGKTFFNDYPISTYKKMAKIIEKNLQPDTDLIFAPATAMPFAYLNAKLKIPKVIYADSTWINLLNMHKDYTNLTKCSLRNGYNISKASFDYCDLILFSSDWAANSAINDYGISDSKIKIVPFGANLSKNNFDNDAINRIIEERNTNTCNLLFVGVEWKRKGGDIVLQIAEQLHNQGIKVHLDIVGIKENLGKKLPYYITNHRFIGKKTEDGINKIKELFIKANFFVMPVRNECFGIVFAEAASYGLPSIANKVDGVPTSVKDGVSGKLFELDTEPEKYANYILELFNNKEEYKKLCLSSYKYYEECLNWDVAGTKVAEYLNEIVS